MSAQFNKDYAYYKELFHLNDDDFKPIVEASKKIPIEERATYFESIYEWMRTSPTFKPYYQEDAIAHSKANEEASWEETTNPFLSDDYINNHKASGVAYSSLGVPLEIYIAGIQTSRHILLDIFTKYKLNTIELVNAIHKETAISVSIISDTYNEAIQQAILEKNAVLMALSTPVTQLWNGILLLPLVGIIDSKRAQDVMSAMLTKIADTQARVFILDISGIAVVDTAVANYLIKITKATQLMGCRCLISGISGAVAQTIVELGIQIDEVETTGNMQDALRNAFSLTGAKIIAAQA